MVENNPTNGIYVFDESEIEKLYVCSDLEGSNPFKFEPTDKVYDMKMEKQISIMDEIEKKDGNDMVLTTEDVKNSVVSIFTTDLSATDGIITNIGEKVALAYTGDLFDNRPYSLRLLKAMIQLKESKSKNDRVIIIGGNRDYNKLRLGIELFMVDKTRQHPFQETTDRKLPSLKSLVERNDLQYVMTGVPEYLIHKKWKSGINTLDLAMKDVYEEINADKRLENILGKSFGAKYQAYTREVYDIFSSELSRTAKKLNRLLSLLFMAMCFDWGENNLVSETKIDSTGKEVTDEDGRRFNSMKGLIYRYMQLMHPVAYFDFGGSTNKNGFLSHSGVMDFTAPLGFNPGAGTDKTDMTIIMQLLLDDKNKLLVEYNRLKDNIKNIKDPNNYLTLVRYIGITAPPHDDHSIVTKGPGFTNNFKKLNLPIVGGSIYNKIFSHDNYPMATFKDKYESINPVLTLRLEQQEGQHVKYNIFGHQPNPFFPTVANEGGTLNIGLDVCKNDFGDALHNNNYSFAILLINKNDKDKFIGRTKFGYNDDEKNINTHDNEYKNRIMYYFNDIEKFPLTKDKDYKKLILYLIQFDIESRNEQLELQIRTVYPDFSRHVKGSRISTGGSNHICSKNCKKCHKHDHHCMLKCRLCDKENCRKKHKTRKLTKKTNVTRHVKKYRRHRPRKNTRKRHTKKRRAGKSS
jgi:hypothetical protein